MSLLLPVCNTHARTHAHYVFINSVCLWVRALDIQRSIVPPVSNRLYYNQQQFLGGGSTKCLQIILHIYSENRRRIITYIINNADIGTFVFESFYPAAIWMLMETSDFPKIPKMSG